MGLFLAPALRPDIRTDSRFVLAAGAGQFVPSERYISLMNAVFLQFRHSKRRTRPVSGSDIAVTKVIGFRQAIHCGAAVDPLGLGALSLMTNSPRKFGRPPGFL
jgi:hypothetical protein